MWDVFISHASEDKDQIARPLAEELRKRRLNVWYDDFSLELGDSLRGSIDKGLAQSRFGVVILSQKFFAKEWPQRELNGLTTRETSGGDKVILPLWHGVTHAEVMTHSPVLADRLAFDTTRGISAAADEIEAVVRRTHEVAPSEVIVPQSSEPRGALGTEIDRRASTATENNTERNRRKGIVAIAVPVAIAIAVAVAVQTGRIGKNESPVVSRSTRHEPARPDSPATKQDSIGRTPDRGLGVTTVPRGGNTSSNNQEARVPNAFTPDAQTALTAPGPPSSEKGIQPNSSMSTFVPRSIAEIVSTDEKAVYYDPRYDIPGACPAGGEVVFNGGGGMPGVEAVPCENGKLVFRPLALARWSDRINPNTGHCLAFRPRGGHPVYPSRELTGADEVLTQEGLIGFRIDVSVEHPENPRIVLTRAPGRNGTNPCYL
jgi:hypothetical protein